jgi:hypothetical protein
VFNTQAIIEQKLSAFVVWFLRAQFPQGAFPQWAVDALTAAGIDLNAAPDVVTLAA